MIKIQRDELSFERGKVSSFATIKRREGVYLIIMKSQKNSADTMSDTPLFSREGNRRF